MNPLKMLSDSFRQLRLSEKTLWIAGIVLLVILCVILVFLVPGWLLKVIFFIVAVIAIAYLWLIFDSRRSAPKPAVESAPQEPFVPPLSQAETKQSAEEEVEEGEKTPTPAENAVLVTENGEKYHRDTTCAGLRFADSIKTMPEAKAREMGKSRCGICWPGDGA